MRQIEEELAHEHRMKIIISIILAVMIAFSIIIALISRKNRKMNKILREHNKTISKQKQQLEEENKLKAKLLSILSHDLRTPLSSVHLLVQMLRSDSLPRNVINSRLMKLEESLDCSSQMLENLLFWAKNQMNGIIYSPENIDLATITDEVLIIVGTHLQNKNIYVDNQIHLAKAYADREMTNIIIRNLITNAVKYTPKGGKITITGNRQDSKIIWRISDTGIGIPEKLKSKIFTNEIKSARGTNMERGLGLGLTLCRNFALTCKGNIDFESEEGKGTTFKLSLPPEKIVN
jgi:signal transduction histidine kinase